MAKKSWFSLLKRFFTADRHSKPEKKGKRRRWVFGRLKIKRLPSVSAPSLSRERPISEAEKEQSKHSVNAPPSTHHCTEDTQEFSVIDVRSTHHQWERGIEDIAATRIQSSFRAYLARKALRALKGLVRLQAIIRGRAVRRQAMTTLRCLESIVSIQSKVCARRYQMVEGTCNFHENKELQDFKEKVIKVDANSERRWDDSLLSKDEANALFLSKREAVVKRERIKEYSSIHRRSAESEQSHLTGRWRYWLEQWVDTQLSKNPETIFPSNTRIREERRGQQPKPRSFHEQHHHQHQAEVFDSPISVPRRSFHKKRHSFDRDNNGNNGGFPCSPILPTYMAATESAKARARSVSSPRLRGVGVCLDAYSELHSPYKHKLSPISSINSEVMSSGGIGNLSGFIGQRSPCLKGLPGSGSEFSLPNWDRSKWLIQM